MRSPRMRRSSLLRHPRSIYSISEASTEFRSVSLMASALPVGGMVFTAIAEDTEDTYTDGTCAGAAIGIADRNGNLLRLHQLDQTSKSKAWMREWKATS